MIIYGEPFDLDTKKGLIDSIHYLERMVNTDITPMYQLNNKSKKYLRWYFEKLNEYNRNMIRNSTSMGLKAKGLFTVKK